MTRLSALSLFRPMMRSVFQRNSEDFADIPVVGFCEDEIIRVEARFVSDTGCSNWRLVSQEPTRGQFAETLRVPAGGWYRIEVRAFGLNELVAESAVDKVGVGEVFITAGQSNSTNSGDVPTIPSDDRVSAWTGVNWQFAADPQPIATHTGGSAWPSMCNLLIAKIGVPIGLISVGVGGTPINDWLHTGTYDVIDCYPRLREALVSTGMNGVRAVLWHQGEANAVRGTSAEVYAAGLRRLIAMSRRDAGWCVPWFVAEASWVDEEHRANQPAVQKAQLAVCDGETVFQGPTTDDMGDEWRNSEDSLHFNEKGSREHGHRWAVVLLDHLRSLGGHSEKISR